VAGECVGDVIGSKVPRQSIYPVIQPTKFDSSPRLSQCEDQHFSFLADMSLNQRVMNAPPYIAQWTNEHPKWVAVWWRCDYGGSKEKT
jgi:hypothetical protein